MPNLHKAKSIYSNITVNKYQVGREETEASSRAQGQPYTFLITEGQADQAVETSQSKEHVYLLTCQVSALRTKSCAHLD